MTPISTTGTAIEEVILLRKAKRLPSNIRSSFSSFKGRSKSRTGFVKHLQESPFSVESFKRLTHNIHEILADDETDESQVLERGYF